MADPDAPRPSLAEFTREIEAAIRETGYQGAFTRDEAQGLIGIEGGGSLSIPYYYEQLAGHPRERRRELLAKAAKMLVHPATLPATWAELAPRVRLVVKPQMALVAEGMRRQAGLGHAEVWASSITEHLAFELAVPYEDGTLTVPRETLAGWGVTPDEAFRTAATNESHDGGRPWKASPQYPGVYVSPWRDGRDAGRLIFPQLFTRMPLQGRPVVMLPSTNRMLVAGSEDEQGLVHMARLAKKTVDESGVIYVLRTIRLSTDDMAWEDWLPSRGHPAYDAMRQLQAMGERRDYEEHGALVAEVARAKGVEPVVLPRLEVVVSKSTGVVMTVTTWRSGKPVALPKADAIVLRQGAKTLGLALWDDLQQALPGQLKPLPGYPVRHLATDFPEEWQLGGLDLKPWSGAG